MDPKPTVIEHFSRVAPKHRDLYYDGAWQKPHGGYRDTWSPSTDENLGPCAEADAADVDAAVGAAGRAAKSWRNTRPTERAAMLKRAATVLVEHIDELAMLDAINCGNPLTQLRGDIRAAAAMINFAAGLVTEVKGETVPTPGGIINLSLREPYGVVGRLVAYNHPLLFVAAKMAPPLITGNAVIMKPPHQAPLSTYRFLELIEGIFPPGILNVLTADRPGSEALVVHPGVPRISLVGSVPTGRAVARLAADRLKHTTLELGGKNACIIYPDADVEQAARAAAEAMNLAWCGQSCGSISRLFLHEQIHDQAVGLLLKEIKRFKPALPVQEATTMGCVVSRAQFEKVMGYIQLGKEQGAKLACGGRRPDDPALAAGFFVEPTVFTDVCQDMRIANEEVFGPVLSVIAWNDEAEMLEQVNRVEYGLTASIWTKSLDCAHRAAGAVEAGYIWVNSAGAHSLGTNFGGYKQSGIGRENGLEELLSYTQQKNVNITIGESAPRRALVE